MVNQFRLINSETSEASQFFFIFVKSTDSLIGDYDERVLSDIARILFFVHEF